jgi:short-subunit dehydrogenase
MEFQESAIILGGTRGLGRELAIDLLANGVRPIIMGRNILEAQQDSDLSGAVFAHVDLARVERWSSKVLLNLMQCGPPVTQVYWVAGIRQRAPLHLMAAEEISDFMSTHINGPMVVLGAIYKALKDLENRTHFITVTAAPSHSLRCSGALYQSVVAFKTEWALRMSEQLHKDLPGSFSTLVLPNEMKTGFWSESEVRTMDFMDPATVAEIIGDHVGGRNLGMRQRSRGFLPVVIDRSLPGRPVVSYQLTMCLGHKTSY